MLALFREQLDTVLFRFDLSTLALKSKPLHGLSRCATRPREREGIRFCGLGAALSELGELRNSEISIIYLGTR